MRGKEREKNAVQEAGVASDLQLVRHLLSDVFFPFFHRFIVLSSVVCLLFTQFTRHVSDDGNDLQYMNLW